jgi:hypothetical protein
MEKLADAINEKRAEGYTLGESSFDGRTVSITLNPPDGPVALPVCVIEITDGSIS